MEENKLTSSEIYWLQALLKKQKSTLLWHLDNNPDNPIWVENCRKQIEEFDIINDKLEKQVYE